MTADLLLPVAVKAGPTRRDAEGLALSSRNRFLTPAEQARAPMLHRMLRRVADDLREGGAALAVLATAIAELEGQGFAVEYLALVDGESLAVLDSVRAGARLLVAARLGTVRLLDNIAAD